MANYTFKTKVEEIIRSIIKTNDDNTEENRKLVNKKLTKFFENKVEVITCHWGSQYNYNTVSYNFAIPIGNDIYILTDGITIKIIPDIEPPEKIRECYYGPNDYGYICLNVRDAAKSLKRAQELFSMGHYPHSNAKIIPPDNPLRLAMKQLKKLDVEYCSWANLDHDEELFKTFKPTKKDIHRWDAGGYMRPKHANGSDMTNEDLIKRK